MNSNPKRQVWVRLSIDYDAVCVIELLGITVGRGKRHHHHLSFVERAISHALSLTTSRASVTGSIGAQEFIYCRRNQRRLGHQPRAIIRMLRQVPQHDPDRAPRGIDPREQQKPQRIADLLITQRPSFELRVEKEAYQTVLDRVLSGASAFFP